MTDNAVATQKQEVIPAYITQNDRRGKEHITREDMRMPRLSLAQGMSPQVTKGDPSFIPELRIGDAFNDLTGEVYGDVPLDVVIVRTDRPRWVEFGEDRGVVDPDVKPGDPRTEFTTDPITKERVKPIATKYYDYVILLGSNLEPMALSFKGSGIKTAMRLNTLINIKPVPVFACRYQLTSTQMKNDQGTWYVFSVRQNGFVDEETYKKAEALFETIKEKAVEFDKSAPEETPEL
jgi:hypothetical protein